MIGRFILECDLEYLEEAQDAIIALQENPNERMIMTSTVYGDDGIEVHMSAVRLKRSIRVRQVKP